MECAEARAELNRLIEIYETKFKNDKELLRNEKQICESLILPLIRNILHWNTQDPSEFKLEQSRVGKRPDYVTYHQNMTQFIIEAKAATVDVFEDDAALKQTMDYVYNADKDFAILTNFRQIAILTPKIQYKRTEKEAVIAKIDILQVKDSDLQLLLGFEKEYWLASGKKNVLYEQLRDHKPAIPVDTQLLDDMKNWREQLLRNIKKNNPKYDFDDEHEFAEIEKEVQKFIDRLVFICCCEDKEIHHEPTLKQLLNQKKEDRYVGKAGWLLSSIQDLFEKYRQMPDSDLFDSSKADKFKIDDDKILEVLTDLREPKNRPAYNFDHIDEDILGKVYENFIGHVQTGKKRFKEKEDKGKRKKEGIYYTPKYIVEYIVNNTVREYVKGKSFEEILKVKVLDPACGSGSFLLRAFNVLLEESEHALKRSLSYTEKKQVLLSCIYGVDLDERAVEITKLTFSLKLAQIREGLPVLSSNIRHGNSLIDEKDIAGYNAFRWDEEFKEIMDNGGFDVVIGNPPWGADINEQSKSFYLRKYHSTNREIETQLLFIERSFDLITKTGLIGYIVPNTWMYLQSTETIRKDILNNCSIAYLLELAKHVFSDAPDIVPVIIILKKELSESKRNSNVIKSKSYSHMSIMDSKDFLSLEYNLLRQEDILTYSNHIFNPNLTPLVLILLKKISHDSMLLSDIAKTHYGIKTGNNVKNLSGEKKKTNFVKCLKSKEVARYYINWNDLWLDYGDHLAGYRKDSLNVKKIIVQYIRKISMNRRLIAAIDETGEYYPLNNYSYITADTPMLYYLLAILNSKLMNFYFSYTYIDYNIKPSYISKLPIKKGNDMERLVGLTKEILVSYRSLMEAKSRHSNEVIHVQKKINQLDNDIDQEVYRIYGLSGEDMKIIEAAIK